MREKLEIIKLIQTKEYNNAENLINTLREDSKRLKTKINKLENKAQLNIDEQNELTKSKEEFKSIQNQLKKQNELLIKLLREKAVRWQAERQRQHQHQKQQKYKKNQELNTLEG